MQLTPGSRLGNYEIAAPLGSGGMGEVFKARDTRLNRLVAIKVLRGDLVSNANRKQRFIQEAQSASALNHPNIVTIYDIFQHEGTDCLVMEYIAGKTLDALIPRQGMRLNEALRSVRSAGNERVTIPGFGLAKLSASVELGARWWPC